MPMRSPKTKTAAMIVALALGLAACGKDDADPGAARADLTDAATDIAAGADTPETTRGGLDADAALAEANSASSYGSTFAPPADPTAVTLEGPSVTDGLPGATTASAPGAIDPMSVGTGTAGGFPTSEPTETQPATVQQ